MKKQLFLIALAGAALVPAVTTRAQILPGPFEDFYNTWIFFQNAETEPPAPVDRTFMDFAPDPLPADFFGPGSDPFAGAITLRGFHDGTLAGNADTIVRRNGDPVAQNDPPGTVGTVPIEIVELKLVSAEPVRITGTGTNWQVDSFFDVIIELSPSLPSTGQLTATKTHNNGGTFDSFFDVFVRITFTNVADPTDVRVFDNALDLSGPLRLEIVRAPWVHQVLIPELIVDPNSQFHPFVQDDGTGAQVEVPADAGTPPGTLGPIWVHHICLPKPERVCIYQLDCKSGPAANPNACAGCPYQCGLYQGSKCPNFTCSPGFSAVCAGTECCMGFTLVGCQLPAGEPSVPFVTAACTCTDVLGACCQTDGTCAQTTECACAGTWQGAGTTCGPTQACCLPDGTCRDGVAQTCCENDLGGTSTAGVCLGDLDGNGVDDLCETTQSCPLASTWCDALTADCIGGAAGEQCWPKSLHVAFINNQLMPEVDQCACLGAECGPIDIQPINSPPTDYSVRCINSCPDPTEPCVLHYNGIPTTFSGALASMIPFGVQVTCGCPSTSTNLCPLPPNIGIPDPCKDLQQTDCKNGAANDECRPAVAVITSSGLPIAQTCDCFPPSTDCGPVTVLGDIVSCEGTCPAPLSGLCVVHADGVSTNLVSVHFGDVPVGAALTCGCSDPPPMDCRPNADGSACDPVACPIAGDQCQPKCMAFDPATGASTIVECDCVSDTECHAAIVAPQQVPSCVGACPAGQHCEETVTTDPLTGLVTTCCNCVDNTVCAPTADGSACEQTLCMDPSQKCVPNVIAINPITGVPTIIDCDCVDASACHVEFDANLQPFCQGICPPGETCELFTITSADGTVAFTCECVPVQAECAPNDAKTGCLQVQCPLVGVDPKCRPTAVAWTPGGIAEVLACDCVEVCDTGGSPNNCTSCHVELDAAQQPFCSGTCPPGETCELFGIDTDGDGIRDTWSCDCVPIQIECGPDPTQTFCNPAACPGPNEVCVPILIAIDPVSGQIRVKECECVGQGPGGGCHVNYDPTTLAPFCEGDCPPGQICELFGQDVNNDGVNDVFACHCVDDTIDCSPLPDGSGCSQTICPDTTQICTPTVVQIVPGAVPQVLVCDCLNPDVDCHVEFNAAGPFCAGTCPAGQTCELRTADTNGDGVDDTFGCDCVPDLGDVCEPNATATACKQTVCPTPGDVCRPSAVTIGPNGQTLVEKCDCVNPDLDCHVELDAAGAPYCLGTCPLGETCELLGTDANNDGIDDTFICHCVPPAGECQPDATGLSCAPTICPVPGDICRPKVMFWVPGALPVVSECECVSPNDCHIEFDTVVQAPVCVGGCPPGETCRLTSEDLNGDGIPDKWECVCVPLGGECSPTDDGSACQDTVCPIAGEICLPSVVTMIAGVPVVEACDCVSPNLCHLEFDAATGPVCVGECPPGEVCRLFKSVNAAGEASFQCQCIPDQTVCQPTADGQMCSQTVCPVAGQVCIPTSVSCTPGAGCVVSSCECGDPAACHVNLAPPATSPPVVCEGACPPGFTCVLRGSDTDGDGIRDTFGCLCIIKPIIVAVDNAVLKSRFISLSRPAGVVAGVTSEAIRVRAVIIDGFPAFDGTVRWVGLPADFPDEDSSDPTATFKAARLECDPLFRDWSADGVVQVYGGMLVPSSQYVVQAVNVSCPDLSDENCYSDLATITTGQFGDIVDPFFINPADVQPDFKDITTAVAKFLGDPAAPIKARVQMQPNTPFVARPIDFKDINVVVRAFLGDAYADIPGLTGPCVCPSTVTCGATACAADRDCGIGFCVDGFCVDACQRCTP